MNQETVRPESFIGATVFSLAGPLIWALHLALLYATQHVLCATASDAMFLYRVCAVFLTFILAGGLSAGMLRRETLLRWLRGNTGDAKLDHFLLETMRWLSLLSLLGIIWTLMTIALIPSCAALR